MTPDVENGGREPHDIAAAWFSHERSGEMTADDALALQAWLDADPAHAQELHAWMVRYGPALRRYFQKRVGHAEAEDLVQDVFLAMQSRGAGAQIENVEGYLFRIAATVLARR